MILRNFAKKFSRSDVKRTTARMISYDTIGGYSSGVMEKLDARTSPSHQVMDRLFGLKHFTDGVNSLVDNNHEKAERLLKEALEEVFMEQLDSPSVLNVIFSRIAVAQISLDKPKDLEETLRELFLVNLSDPNCDSETFFKSIFNLLVFYIKNDVEKGKKFEDFYRKVSDQINLPLIYHSEIEMLFGVIYHLSGDLEKAIGIYERVIEDAENTGFMSKGLLLNNYGVGLMNHAMETGKENNQRIKQVFEDSVLELENLKKTEEDDMTEEQEKSLRDYIFEHNDDKAEEESQEKYFTKLTNSNSSLPLMNLSEVYQRERDSKYLTHLTMLNMRLTKNSGNIAGNLRIFPIIAEFHLAQGEANAAIRMLEEAVYILGFYKIENYLKIRVLGDYAEALNREERFFESSEMFQKYGRLRYEEREVNEEMMFIPEYWI